MNIVGIVAMLLGVAATQAKVTYREVISAAISDASSARLVLALDEKSFEKEWRPIAGKSDWPPIDFKEEAAIIITAGEKPTSGYHVKMNGIVNEKGTLVVDAVVTSPEPGAMTAQVITSPYLVIAIPNAGVTAARWKNPPKAANAPASK